MHVTTSIRAICCLLLLLLAPLSVAAADVLQNVPNDALGFIVIKNLGATDAKANELLKTFQSDFLGPLAFLRAITGVQDGLETGGDLLIAVLPATPANASPRFALWLPVNDYDLLLKSLVRWAGASITAVSVADEDVLVAKHGNWALVMDPDQRPAMERMISATPEPPSAIATWNGWIHGQDVAIVALRDGIRAALDWARPDAPVGAQSGADFESTPFEFGPGDPEVDQFAAPSIVAESDDIAGILQAEIRKWTAYTPQLNEWILEADAIALAVRVDENGNAIGGLRARCQNGDHAAAIGGSAIQPQASLYDSGNFVFHGAGKLPSQLGGVVAGMFVRSILHELKENEQLQLSEATVAEFKQAFERAVADAAAFEVLNRAGDGKAGVYTNEFLAVTTNDAAVFAGHAAEVMRIWNLMNSESQGQMPLAFEVEEVKIGARTATQYSLDIAAADGAPPLPEIRQTMEKFFGPGGKVRLWIVPVDQNTVVLASATKEEVAGVLTALDRKHPVDWQRAELGPTSKLVPQQADWRLYFSPQAYNTWLRRYYEAMMGDAVVGGPLVDEFAASPPVGFTGNFRDGELQIEAAAPAATIKAAGAYRAK